MAPTPLAVERLGLQRPEDVSPRRHPNRRLVAETDLEAREANAPSSFDDFPDTRAINPAATAEQLDRRKPKGPLGDWLPLDFVPLPRTLWGSGGFPWDARHVPRSGPPSRPGARRGSSKVSPAETSQPGPCPACSRLVRRVVTGPDGGQRKITTREPMRFGLLDYCVLCDRSGAQALIDETKKHKCPEAPLLPPLGKRAGQAARARRKA